MTYRTARFSGYITRAWVTAGICGALLALTPRSAAAITVCTGPGHCVTFGGIEGCDWVNHNTGLICFESSIATLSPTATLVRARLGGAVLTFTSPSGLVISHVLSDANAARFAKLIERSRSLGRMKTDRESDQRLRKEFQKDFSAIVESPDRNVSEQRLAEISREYKLKISEAR